MDQICRKERPSISPRLYRKCQGRLLIGLARSHVLSGQVCGKCGWWGHRRGSLRGTVLKGEWAHHHQERGVGRPMSDAGSSGSGQHGKSWPRARVRARAVRAGSGKGSQNRAERAGDDVCPASLPAGQLSAADSAPQAWGGQVRPALSSHSRTQVEEVAPLPALFLC